MTELDARYPGYAPGRFLKQEYETARALEPRPLQALTLTLASERGDPISVEIHAVLVPVSRSRAAVMFVDNGARLVFGQRYVDGYEEGEAVTRLVADVMQTIRGVYERESRLALGRRQGLPPASETIEQIRRAVTSKTRSAELSREPAAAGLS